MTLIDEATTDQEVPVFFAAGEETLFGVVTEPTRNMLGIAVVVFSGGGTPLSINVNDLSVRLCRRIAAYGFHSLRFDYHGVGESTGAAPGFHLASPFLPDAAGALQMLRARGIGRFVLVGSCFGGRTALSLAATAEDVAGLLLVSPPVRDFEMGERTSTHLAAKLNLRGYLRRALKPKTLRGFRKAGLRRLYARLAAEKIRSSVRRSDGTSREHVARYLVSQRFIDQLSVVMDREIPIAMVFGEGDDLFADFTRAKARSLGPILDRGRERYSLTTIEGTLHGFRRFESQERVMDLVSSWLRKAFLASNAEGLPPAQIGDPRSLSMGEFSQTELPKASKA